MYTPEILSKINQRFLSAHYELTESDVEKVNTCVELLEKSRTPEKPMPGDIVQYTDEHGNYYSSAFIEKVEDNKAYIAEHANSYLDLNEESETGISVFVSAGGAFHYIPLEQMIYTDKQTERRFWHFGHCGGCADGGIDFYATVNVWECDLNEERYSTRTHDKHYISYDPEPDKFGGNYQFVSDKHKAWKTEEDFQAWLRTFRGVVEPGGTKLFVVWAYKQVEHHCSPEEYAALKAFEDTFLMNGSVRRCKRIYDDKNYTVHTYYVWYWNDPEKDFYERAAEQNEIIDSYTLDWRTHKENEYARKELNSGKIQTINLKLEG